MTAPAGGGEGGTGSKLLGFAAGVFAIIVVINGAFNRLDDKPFFSGILTSSSGPGGGSQGGSASVGNPPCPFVDDARQVQNTLCRSGDIQLSWRGKNNYCVAPKPSANSRLCANQRSGNLAWWTP